MLGAQLKKFLKIAVVGALLVTVVAGITLFTQLDSLIKAAIESVGPRMTLSSVKVGSVNISPFSGTGRIRKLEIGNPRGFQSETALKLKDVRVSLVPRSLTSEKIVIRELIIEGPEITYELTPAGNNLQRIQKNVESFIPATKTEGRTAKGADTKLELDLFVLKDAKVHVRSRILGNQELNLTLPQIVLKDIGKKPGGASVKDVLAAVMRELTNGVTKAVADSGVLKNVQQTIQSTKGTVQKALKNFLGR